MAKLDDDLTGLATLLIGVAFAALLVSHATNAAQLISAGTSGFNTLLNTVETGGTSNTSSGNNGGILQEILNNNPLSGLSNLFQNGTSPGGVESFGGFGNSGSGLGGFGGLGADGTSVG